MPHKEYYQNNKEKILKQVNDITRIIMKKYTKLLNKTKRRKNNISINTNYLGVVRDVGTMNVQKPYIFTTQGIKNFVSQRLFMTVNL